MEVVEVVLVLVLVMMVVVLGLVELVIRFLLFDVF